MMDASALQQSQLLIASKTVGTEGMLQFSSRILHSDRSQYFYIDPYIHAHVIPDTHRGCDLPAGRHIEINDNQNGQQNCLFLLLLFLLLLSFLSLVFFSWNCISWLQSQPQQWRIRTGFHGHNSFNKHNNWMLHAPLHDDDWDTCQPTMLWIDWFKYVMIISFATTGQLYTWLNEFLFVLLSFWHRSLLPLLLFSSFPFNSYFCCFVVGLFCGSFADGRFSIKISIGHRGKYKSSLFIIHTYTMLQ